MKGETSMHHRISGYNRVAMSERRKDAALSRGVIQMCIWLKSGIVSVNMQAFWEIRKAVEATTQAAIALGQAGKAVLDAYNQNR
jgi:hypothetical protein